ncbi:MAG: hypothetical protein MUP76_10515 [Acidimicrobiia bacterium]|nr:hypothetical protein [Acidimicrobiia bacterium]
MVDAADGVVFRLDLDDPYHREMLRCYRARLGEIVPMHIVLKTGQQHRLGRLLDGLPFSIGGLGPGLPGFSSQVSMAAAVRTAFGDWDE